VQVRALSSPDHNVWVSATDIELDANIADLPVTDCATFDGVVAIGDTPADSSTTTTLAETTTTVDASTTTTTPSATTTKPTTSTTQTTSTTTPPDTTPPQISQPSAKPAEIWEEDGFAITCEPVPNRQSTISAVVTDNFGVTSVTASWTDPIGNLNVAMSGAGNTYTITFGPYAAGDWDPSGSDQSHLVTITITAGDAAGNKSSTTVSVTVWEIGACFG
jgi:hypothetical protein